MSDILLLDNLDSFTYNLVDALRSFGQTVTIYRNYSTIPTLILALEKMFRPIVVFSPGPGIPKKSGCMLKFIRLIKGKIPILGICLGHQAIIQSYGGKIVPAKKILHGKTSCIVHDEQDMFASLPNPLLAARYHSLIGTDIPNTLRINARCNSAVMAVTNHYDRVCGFQFHPESILTIYGTDLLRHTLNWLRA
uniref:anthranilate synthase n=1 Tax=Buchnera aphidicola (Cinara cedri) TaxID=261318 RepID=B4YQR2_9GAMM|nr:anthranilate synthase small subunit [Buchnera aphidicola BCc]